MQYRTLRAQRHRLICIISNIKYVRYELLSAASSLLPGLISQQLRASGQASRQCHGLLATFAAGAMPALSGAASSKRAGSSALRPNAELAPSSTIIKRNVCHIAQYNCFGKTRKLIAGNLKSCQTAKTPRALVACWLNQAPRRR